MESHQRSIITNETDTNKLKVIAEGDVDATPTGLVPLWKDAGNTWTAVSGAKPMPVYAMGAAGSISVNVVAGGAGGGIAQTEVKNAAGNWTEVGYAAGNMKVPVEALGAGGSISVNVVAGGAGGGVAPWAARPALGRAGWPGTWSARPHRRASVQYPQQCPRQCPQQCPQQCPSAAS